MVDGKRLSSLPMEQLAIVGPSCDTNAKIDHSYSPDWLCDVPDDIKAAVDKVVSNMRDHNVNGSAVSSLVDKVFVFDEKNSRTIEGLQTVTTNLACVVTFNLDKEDYGLECEIQEMDKTVDNDQLFAIKVARRAQTDKIFNKCIVAIKGTDSEEAVNLLASQRMQTSFLKSVLQKSINKIQQDGNLTTDKGHQTRFNIQDRGNLLVLGIEIVKKDDEIMEEVRELRRVTKMFEGDFEYSLKSLALQRQTTLIRYDIALIPTVKVTQCQHLLPCYKAKIAEAKRSAMLKVKRKKALLEKLNIPEGVNSELLDKMWKLSCLEHHATCPEPNIFTTEKVLPLHEIANTKKPNTNDTIKPDPKDTVARSLSENALRHCESVESEASRLLLKYYYRYGHIAEDEMELAWNCVKVIIEKLVTSIHGDLTEGDPVVKQFFKSGSTAEGLKVCFPNEFDIMIPIEISETDTSSFSVVCQPDIPLGYAVCKVHSTDSFSEKLSKCVIENRLFGRLLSPAKLVSGWFLGLVQKAINKQKSEDPSVRLKIKRKGPAVVLEIQSNLHGIPENIDVDLVLAIKMTDEDVPRYAVAKTSSLEAYYKTKLEEEAADDDGEAVETGKDYNDPVRLQDQDLKCLWRVSYSVQEKRYLEIIKEQHIQQGLLDGCHTVCLKIIKTIRERECLKKADSIMGQKLHTYLLKTCLYHVLASKPCAEYWSYERLADRYLDVLNYFLKCLQDNKLAHFFYEREYELARLFPGMAWNVAENRMNLLNELHSKLRDQLYTRVKQIRDSFREKKRDIEGQVTACSDAKTHHNASKTSEGGNVPKPLPKVPSAASDELDAIAKTVVATNSSYVPRKQTLAETSPIQIPTHLNSISTGKDLHHGLLKTCTEGSLPVFKASNIPGQGKAETNLSPEKQLTSMSDQMALTSMSDQMALTSMTNQMALDVYPNERHNTRTRFKHDHLPEYHLLEQIVHPDFEAMPWCKRGTDDSLADDIARKMAKDTRKHGISDFGKLKTKCTVDVERQRQEREEESDEEYYSESYDHYDYYDYNDYY